MHHIPSFRDFTDSALIAEVRRLAGSEREATALLVASLAEFDQRRLHLSQGYSSTFDYCRKALGLTEHESLNRIEAARAIRQHPMLLEKLRTGAVSLTAIRLLAPHLTSANVGAVVAEAKGLTTEGIRLLIAKLHPRPPVPAVIRKLPAVSTTVAVAHSIVAPAPAVAQPMVAAPAPPSRRPVVAPLSEQHYKLQVTISAVARQRLSAIQDLMRHRLPNGDPAAIVEHALEVLHAELLKQKAAQVATPRTGKQTTDAKGRYIPASVKREVWRRDQGRCAFVAADGARCGSGSGVEFHHVQPYAAGGQATAVNIELRCRAHNGFEWERHLDLESAALAGRQRADPCRTVDGGGPGR